MSFSTYADLWRQRDVRRILVLSFWLRVPIPAFNVVIVLHVVGHLHRSYAEAGVVAMVSSIALAVSSPWRGRTVDRLGLRRSVAPSLGVLAVAWSLAAFAPYLAFLGLAVVASLFAVPTFSITRQVLLAVVAPAQRTTALSADAVVTELAWMAGPVLGVLLATWLPTTLALLLVAWVSIAAAGLLWLVNPPISAGSPATPVDVSELVPRRRMSWMTPGIALLLVATFAASAILTSEDLSSVAAMRSMDRSAFLGLVLALWALGSLIGAVVYGALSRRPPMAVLLVLLGATATLVSVAQGPVTYAVLLVLSGAFCAPTLTASVDDLSRLAPVSVRGEVMGWQGSAITLGSAAGAPLVGAAIDSGGWQWGLVLGGAAGLVIAGIVLALHRRIFPAMDPSPVAEDACL